MEKSKNEKLLKSFSKYCAEYPEQRFWQALRNWAEIPFIYAGTKPSSEIIGGQDTFYWEEKNR